MDQCYLVQRYNGAESLISSLSRPLVSKPGTGSRYERDQTDESRDTYSQAEVAPSKNFPIDYRCEDSGRSGNEAGEGTQDQPNEDRLVMRNWLSGNRSFNTSFLKSEAVTGSNARVP